MQAAGIQPGGQVALSVAQRGVLGNPGGATGNLGGAAAPIQRRGGAAFRRQVQAGIPQAQAGTPQLQGGTPTNGNNPVATQLLLAPTFTPIQADVVLDTVNMRVAFPVSAVDGEFLITMQTGAPQAQAPQAAPEGQGQTPAAPQGQGQTPPTPQQTEGLQTPTPEGQTPPAGEATPTEGARPTESQTPEARPAGEVAPAGESRPTESQNPEPPRAAGNGTVSATEGEKKAERRQEKKAPAIGDKAPQGQVYLTMKEVNQMADLMQWGGQAPISQMMTDYVKANNGTSAN
jgi:X-X-X-Leu-X-X-Gly heptad repeat protein